MAKMDLPSQLNICITSEQFPMLGRSAQNSFLWRIAKGVASQGHFVTVLSNESSHKVAEIEQDGVHAYFLSAMPEMAGQKFTEKVRTKFAELHREKPFHLVHSLDNSAYKIAKFSEKFHVAVAFDVEATHMSQIFSILSMSQEKLGSLIQTYFSLIYRFLRTYLDRDRKIFNHADGIFVSAPQQRVFLERYYMYPDSKTYTVGYGIEVGDLTPRESAQELKQQLKLTDDMHVVVSVTDMTDVSEIKHLFKAFEKLVIKKPQSRLILVGQGPKKKEIEYEMLNLALGNKVIMTGAIKNMDLSDYISLADVFVNISSRTTGFEPSILEAMAQKKVIIGSEVSAIANVIDDTPEGRDGFLVRPADSQYLGNLLIEIFSGALPIAEIGDRARRKVIDFFDPNKMIRDTIDAYYSILKRTGLYKTR